MDKFETTEMDLHILIQMEVKNNKMLINSND